MARQCPFTSFKIPCLELLANIRAQFECPSEGMHPALFVWSLTRAQRVERSELMAWLPRTSGQYVGGDAEWRCLKSLAKRAILLAEKNLKRHFNAMSESFVLLLARTGEDAPSWGSTLNIVRNEFPAGGILSRLG